METLHLRQSDYHFIIDCVQSNNCCSIVGLSNTGKSTLFRDLTVRSQEIAQSTNGPKKTFVYVDCNLMLAASVQGFYEAILRALREALSQKENDHPELLKSLNTYYQKTVKPESPFLIPLSFNDAIIETCRTLGAGIVLLLDEFDQAFARLDGRAFLNLRALHDKYRRQLTYVTATLDPLREIRSEPDVGEFCELFTHHERYLGMLTKPDSMALLNHLAEIQQVVLDNEEIEFIWRQAGGHPGLLEAVAHLVIKLEVGAPELYREAGLQLVLQQLDESEIAHAECVKLWEQLPKNEQDELLRFSVEGPALLSATTLASLTKKGVLKTTGQLGFYGERFAAFVGRRRRIELDYPEGIWLDVDSGDVWVEGCKVPTLTDLEFRLLQTLYGRLEKLCNKYLIVESVWGQEYIDTVDDARIEKLISRLRSKIEPNPNEPCYLITVRGRGYRLLPHPTTA